jgi:predicted secreted protein
MFIPVGPRPILCRGDYESPWKGETAELKENGTGLILVCQVLVLVFMAFGVQTWASGGNMEKEPDVILQKQDNGKEVTLNSGQVIQVQLEGMGGTGYWWYVQDLNRRYFDLLSEKTKSVSDGRVGGPVLGLWTFRVKEPGATEIKMDYYRSWEGVAKAAEHFRVKMNIE